ncbi:hypothetical protein KQI38_09690 [Tissierella carlieri]|uniref:hypothetical protein n=1 Tax=Tissierella carlieri TaxID=689904 RepID=UPI001C1213DA|nr:hypothetical protein [Tissierella carlieri]MBU5312300.1 hypothetical protein [Tissierella carlieri]
MDKLLTKKDLAERWQVTTATIDRWMSDKIITPVKGIPSVRFSMQHILELEGVKLDRFSPLERKRLEKEKMKLEEKIIALEGENIEMKEYIKSVFTGAVRFM